MFAERSVKGISNRRRKLKRGLGWGPPRLNPNEWEDWIESAEDDTVEDEQAVVLDDDDDLNEGLDILPPQAEEIADYVDVRAAESGRVYRSKSIKDFIRREAEEEARLKVERILEEPEEIKDEEVEQEETIEEAEEEEETVVESPSDTESTGDRKEEEEEEEVPESELENSPEYPSESDKNSEEPEAAQAPDFGGARPKENLKPPFPVFIPRPPADRSVFPTPLPQPMAPLPPSQNMRWQAPPQQQPNQGAADILQLLPQFLPPPMAMVVQALLHEYKTRADAAEKQQLGTDSILQAIQALNNNTKILIDLNRGGAGRGPRSGSDFQNRKGSEGPGEGRINQITYADQQVVEIKVVFVRVMDIDTISQQFDAEIYLQARWAESQFAGMSEQDLENVEFCHCWDPRLKILNVVGDYDSDKTSMLLRYEEDRVYPVLSYMWHVRGLFREHLELQHFPFDVQELSIVVSSERPVYEIELVEDFYHPSSVNPRALEESQDWTSYRHVQFTRDFTTKELVGTTKHPVLVAAAHVKRKLGFYLWNVVVIVFLILCLSLTVLSIDPTGSDRLGVTVTLFLTAVAFKLVVKTTLPTISYLTYLDIYVVFTLIYLALQAAENAFMTHLARYNDREQVLVYDEIAQSLLIALLILFHLGFIIYIQLTALQRRRAMSNKDHEFLMARLNRKKARDLQIAAAEAAQNAEMEKSSIEPGPEDPLYSDVATQANTMQF